MKTILILLTLALVGCETMPPITVEGNFADYSYSSKGGIVIRPRTTIINYDK